MFPMNKLKVIFLCFAFLSCEKVQETTIPLTRVYLEIDLAYRDKDLFALLCQKAITQPRTASESTGFGGVLVVHGFDDIYYAYDLACPLEANRSVRLTPLDDGTAMCNSCGTVFDTAYGTGTPLSGASQYPLRKYLVSGSGSVLYVTN